MAETPTNVSTNLSLADRAELSSELKVADLLESAKHQVLSIATQLDIWDTVSDEYASLTSIPDLARTIRLAQSMGAHVSILVTHPDIEQT